LRSDTSAKHDARTPAKDLKDQRYRINSANTLLMAKYSPYPLT